MASERKIKNVLTTGQAAKICNVAARTITKWFDSGKLKGYRLPMSLDRRIPKENLLTFLTQNNMPTEEFYRVTNTKRPVAS